MTDPTKKKLIVQCPPSHGKSTAFAADALAKKARLQCAACPWKKSTVPERDIPNGYCETKHAALKETIAEPGSMKVFGVLRMMACHETKPGKELPCVGWIYNQLGVGNNIGLRMAAFNRAFDYNVKTVGPQHETLEDTLPKKRKRP